MPAKISSASRWGYKGQDRTELTMGQSVSLSYGVSVNRTQGKAPSYGDRFATNHLSQLTRITENPIPVKGSTGETALVSVNGAGTTEGGGYNFQTNFTPFTGVESFTLRAAPLALKTSGFQP